jgi:hypothetical protein
MRDRAPFGYTFGSVGPTVVNFLDIDAKLTLRGEGNRAVYEAPFLFHDKFKTFVPQFAAFKWEDVKEAEVLIEIKYRILGDAGLGEGHYKFTQTWAVRYGKDGIILHSGRLIDLGSKGDGVFVVQVQIQAIEPSIESDSVPVILMLRLAAGDKDDGLTVSVGPVSGNVLPKANVRTKDYEFKVDFFAVGRPREAIEVPDDLLNHDVWFEDEDQPQMSPAELRRLEEKWSDPLRAYQRGKLAAAIQKGECPITLNGHASVTGRSKMHNHALSLKRINSVGGAIKTTFRSMKIVFVPVPQGQMAATQSGPASQERRVEIVIDRKSAIAILSKK